MTEYTGWQYLLIDVANQFGLDKLLFEQRIEWATDNLDRLESLADDAENHPLYMKAVMAIREAQQGYSIGHIIGLDAVCSGIQIMSALTGCYEGGKSTGLVNTGVRPDAYGRTTDVMNQIMNGGVVVPRAKAKEALMTSFYGSKAKPKEIFGEETPELAAFYQAAYTVAPGAWELLQDLLASWQPYAQAHSWKLPDGYDVTVKVMEQNTARIKVDELDGASFTYAYYENQGTKEGRANAANVIHSIDAYILRTIQRRCNYDRYVIEHAAGLVEMEMLERLLNPQQVTISDTSLNYYIEQYRRSGMADVVIAKALNAYNIHALTDRHLAELARIMQYMLSYRPFEVITVHDEFKVHPNNANYLRQQYINILAELSESNILDDLLSQIHGVSGSFKKLTPDLAKHIRQCEYALS